MRVREAAVAGRFYEGDPARLRSNVESMLAKAASAGAKGNPCKAIVAPHAGYVYSGPIAASAYACVSNREAKAITRVVLFGPAHRVALRGVATVTADAFETPLGTIPVEHTSFHADDRAHAEEHSLEVHLPFLQVLLDHRFTLVPVVVGQATIEEVHGALESVWGGPETLVVISTDLSHYETYEVAKRMDRATADAIVRMDPEGIGEDSACGRYPLRGFLSLATARGMKATELDLRSSGDTQPSRSRDEVVGYGAFAFFN